MQASWNLTRRLKFPILFSITAADFWRVKPSPELFLSHYQQEASVPEEYGIPANTLDPSISWKDIHWLQSITRLPIIIKGILTKEDAEVAVEHGVQGIIVSNHGGRQLDGGPASVHAKHVSHNFTFKKEFVVNGVTQGDCGVTTTSSFISIV